MMVTEERYALDTYVSVAYRGRMPDDDDRRSFGFHVSRPGLQDYVVITCNVNFFSFPFAQLVQDRTGKKKFQQIS